MLLQKTKEIYKQRCLELEKVKRDNGSSKELEKSEAKFRKAQVRIATHVFKLRFRQKEIKQQFCSNN